MLENVLAFYPALRYNVRHSVFVMVHWAYYIGLLSKRGKKEWKGEIIFSIGTIGIAFEA